MIPKTIHYCWFGGKEKPKKAMNCLASWKRVCPNFEVIEWNENYFCPKCEHMLSKNRKKKTDIRFCSRCGQAVKWE